MRLNINQMPQQVVDALERLSTLGDLIGSVDTFAHLPEVNNEISGAGLNFDSDLEQIANDDIVTVLDASSEGHGQNALYKAVTTDEEGAPVSWTFLQEGLHISSSGTPEIPHRTLVLTQSVSAAITTPPVLPTAAKAAYAANNAALELFVNGVLETDFAVNADTGAITLTGYTADGWTEDDKLKIFAWL